jgi:hypothetical protein
LRWVWWPLLVVGWSSKRLIGVDMAPGSCLVVGPVWLSMAEGKSVRCWMEEEDGRGGCLLSSQWRSVHCWLDLSCISRSDEAGDCDEAIFLGKCSIFWWRDCTRAVGLCAMQPMSWCRMVLVGGLGGAVTYVEVCVVVVGANRLHPRALVSKDRVDRQYDIAMWWYINCDWESQPMWHNIEFGAHSCRAPSLWWRIGGLKCWEMTHNLLLECCSSQFDAQKQIFSKLLTADARLSIGSFLDKTAKNCAFLFRPHWQCLCIVSVMVVPVLAYVQRKQRRGQVEEHLLHLEGSR